MCVHVYRQLGGLITRDDLPLAFLQNDSASFFLYVSFMSCKLIPLQGYLGLQSNFTATLVADDPLMLPNDTLLILMPELCRCTSRTLD